MRRGPSIRDSAGACGLWKARCNQNSGDVSTFDTTRQPDLWSGIRLA
jgi:hypothetical protein